MNIGTAFYWIILLIATLLFARTGIKSLRVRIRNAKEEEENPSVVEKEGPVSLKNALFVNLGLSADHPRIDFTDQEGNVLYQAVREDDPEKKVEVKQADGTFVGRLVPVPDPEDRSLEGTMADGKVFLLNEKLLNDRNGLKRIEDMFWNIRGNCFRFAFTLYDHNGREVADIATQTLFGEKRIVISFAQIEQVLRMVVIISGLEYMVSEKNASKV